jgi:aminoglycoside phosphotransferase family enzyme/predicted kinase
VAETHSAAVFFLGDVAWKVKKPVDLGFLDFRTLAQRRAACHREVELNRRFSPDVYLGVADLVGAHAEPIEHVVLMRRMPSSRRLSTLAASGRELDAEIDLLAGVVAQAHASARRPSVAREAAGQRATSRRWQRLVHEIEDRVDDPGVRCAARRIGHDAARYLAGRSALFEERIAAGCALDGHGDLLADDIFLLDDGPRILDCLDFDDELRCGDLLADVAFLAMDLERLGRPELARRFLDAYKDAAAATWPSSLEHHHIAERALVRADVAFIRADQGDRGAADAARSLLHLAHAHLLRGRVRLVVVSGLPGTGKSTVSKALAVELDALLLRSDEVRRELDTTSAGRYGDRGVDAVYGELLATAGQALTRGRSVVLDATWRAPHHRQALEALARATVSDLSIIECRAPEVIADERISARSAAGNDPSEATVDVATTLRRTWQGWPAAEPLDTTSSVPDTVRTALRIVHRDEEAEHA